MVFVDLCKSDLCICIFVDLWISYFLDISSISLCSSFTGLVKMGRAIEIHVGRAVPYHQERTGRPDVAWQDSLFPAGMKPGLRIGLSVPHWDDGGQQEVPSQGSTNIARYWQIFTWYSLRYRTEHWIFLKLSLPFLCQLWSKLNYPLLFLI
jgi:hypothetical protein